MTDPAHANQISIRDITVTSDEWVEVGEIVPTSHYFTMIGVASVPGTADGGARIGVSYSIDGEVWTAPNERVTAAPGEVRSFGVEESYPFIRLAVMRSTPAVEEVTDPDTGEVTTPASPALDSAVDYLAVQTVSIT